MIDTYQEALVEMLQSMDKIKAKQLELTKQEQELRAKLVHFMHKHHIEKEDTSYGTIRLQQRNVKNYGEAVSILEKQLKEAKELAEALGDYEVVSKKEVLVYTPPSSPF